MAHSVLARAAAAAIARTPARAATRAASTSTPAWRLSDHFVTTQLPPERRFRCVAPPATWRGPGGGPGGGGGIWHLPLTRGVVAARAAVGGALDMGALLAAVAVVNDGVV
jgi:hypothetical protein